MHFQANFCHCQVISGDFTLFLPVQRGKNKKIEKNLENPSLTTMDIHNTMSAHLHTLFTATHRPKFIVL